MRIFFDLEFTGLHQNTTLISLGCIAADGRRFYAESIDYDKTQLNQWLEDNVISHLYLVSTTDSGLPTMTSENGNCTIIGRNWQIARFFQDWIRQFDSVELWSDVLAYDWMLFCELFGGALSIPDNVYYIPFDIATLMKVKGVDPDVSREEFSEIGNLSKHNALDDARIIKACYEKLMAVTI